MRFFSIALVVALTATVGQAETVAPRDVTFKAAVDGTEQRYVEILPADFDATQPRDLIIGLHGHGSDRWQFATAKRGETDAFRAFAANHGMIAVCPDYRAKTSWLGPKAEADLVQIIDELKKRYKINRVFVAGGSMGGTSSLTFAALHPDLVSGVAALNPLANHLEYKNFQDAIAASFGGTKAQIPEEYKKRSAEYWPEKLTMPIAITVGGKDTLVPPDSAIRLANVLKLMGRKVLLINRPETGHATNFADSTAALEFMLTGVVPAEFSAVPPPATTSPAAALPATVARPGVGGAFFVGGPAPANANAKGHVEIGLKFSVEKVGKIKGFRFFQADSESGPHVARLWDATGKSLTAADAPAKNGPGWVAAPLAAPFAVSPGQVFTVSYTAATAYPATPSVFAAPIKGDGVTAIAGVYSFTQLGERPPDKTFNNINYFVDVDYLADSAR